MNIIRRIESLYYKIKHEKMREHFNKYKNIRNMPSLKFNDNIYRKEVINRVNLLVASFFVYFEQNICICTYVQQDCIYVRTIY